LDLVHSNNKTHLVPDVPWWDFYNKKTPPSTYKRNEGVEGGALTVATAYFDETAAKT
jgi:hypothetical protein